MNVDTFAYQHAKAQAHFPHAHLHTHLCAALRAIIVSTWESASQKLRDDHSVGATLAI